MSSKHNDPAVTCSVCNTPLPPTTKRTIDTCRACYTRPGIEGQWTYDAYCRLQGFSAAERYMVEKLSKQPTLSTALDGLYRRDPRRWHAVLAASAIARRQ